LAIDVPRSHLFSPAVPLINDAGTLTIKSRRSLDCGIEELGGPVVPLGAFYLYGHEVLSFSACNAALRFDLGRGLARRFLRWLKELRIVRAQW
jgi:hypothetical protein